MAHLLAVVSDPHPALSRALASLERSEHEVRSASRAGEAEQLARALPLDALLVDSDGAGRDLLSRLRRAHPAETLIAWTASSSSPLVATLLEEGADEALHAGMGDRELAARIRGALARHGNARALHVELGPLTLDGAHGEASWRGRDLALTRREREVLEVLAENAGRTVRREVLHRRVWGYAMARGERSVDVNVTRLRRKLDRVVAGGLAIKTQPGIGYRLEVVHEREPVTAL